MTTIQLPATNTNRTAANPATATPTTATRALLAGGAIAGPLWAAVALIQAATREGFDITRHPLSALSNGSLGWLQITNFLVAGILIVAGAVGLRRVLSGTPGGRWAPWLVMVSGIGMFAAGLLVMDAGAGFPVGAPAELPTTMSWHSYGHMVAGSISFTALIIGCYVLGRHFSRTGDRRRAIASRVAGTVFLIGDGWAMTGGRYGTVTLAIGAITALVWVAAVCAHYRRAR